MIALLACVATTRQADSEPPVGVLFRFPVAEPERISATVGVDHDPEVHDGAERLICTSYDGRSFPWCYDEHDGSDYLLEGGFEAMDAGSATVVAAAAGRVIDSADGHYDRCHGELSGQVDCDGHSGQANYLILEHTDGVRTMYWHLMSGSQQVAVGDEVACGQPMALVGSSGNSSTPHLHFQLEDPLEQVVDPYAGDYSQPESWWVDQGWAEGLPGTDCAP